MVRVAYSEHMNITIPPGDWVSVTEACELVKDVSRRRIQALGKSRIRSVIVLGRMLLDRAELIAWRDGPREGGRPKVQPLPKKESMTLPKRKPRK
ncbi:MAG: hypothetical protein C0467_27915 [Planctomycetaceae bacterium]|nr:hypothetical protein [Planctomycetaceae bacterium]